MVTKRADQVDHSVAILDKLETAIRSLGAKRDELQAELDRLQSLGFCDAKPHYRDGKYLYLIHLMVDGERKREYIGADPEKIDEALARIERKSQYEELSRKHAEVVTTLDYTHRHLINAISAALQVRW